MSLGEHHQIPYPPLVPAPSHHSKILAIAIPIPIPIPLPLSLIISFSITLSIFSTIPITFSPYPISFAFSISCFVSYSLSPSSCLRQIPVCGPYLYCTFPI